jgi:hypothetical protein
MPEQRHVFRLSRSLVVALPPTVRRHLGVDRGQLVYWHAVRRGEAVLTKAARRAGGHPEGLALARELETARVEVLRLQQRNDARDRAMYAEGYALGRLDGEEVTRAPHGKRANALRGRRMAQHAWGRGVAPGGARGEASARPRAGRPVEVVDAPVLVLPDGVVALEQDEPG